MTGRAFWRKPYFSIRSFRIWVLTRSLASADMPRLGKTSNCIVSFGACVCRKLICSKYRQHPYAQPGAR